MSPLNPIPPPFQFRGDYHISYPPNTSNTAPPTTLWPSNILHRHVGPHPVERLRLFHIPTPLNNPTLATTKNPTTSQQIASSRATESPATSSEFAVDTPILKHLSNERINAMDVCYLPATTSRTSPPISPPSPFIRNSHPVLIQPCGAFHTGIELLSLYLSSSTPFCNTNPLEPISMPIPLQASTLHTIYPSVLKPVELSDRPSSTNNEYSESQTNTAAPTNSSTPNSFKVQRFNTDCPILEIRSDDLHPLNKLTYARNRNGLAVLKTQYVQNWGEEEWSGGLKHTTVYEQPATSTSFICYMCTSPFNYGECSMLSADRKLLLWDGNKQKMEEKLRFSAIETRIHSMQLSNDFPQSITYSSHPKQLIAAGMKLWSIDQREAAAHQLFPYVGSNGYHTDSWRRSNVRFGLNQSSFNYWKCFTAVERHPLHTHLLAAACAANDSLYVLDMRAAFEPLFVIPLPSTFTLMSRYRDLMWRTIDNIGGNSVDTITAYTWRNDIVTSASFTMNGCCSQYSEFEDSLMKRWSMGGDSIGVDKKGNSIGGGLQRREDTFINQAKSSGEAFEEVLDLSGDDRMCLNNSRKKRRRLIQGVQQSKRVELLPLVEFPIGQWSLSSDYKYYRPTGPLVESAQSVWNLPYRVYDDSTVAQLFHGMAGVSLLNIPVTLYRPPDAEHMLMSTSVGDGRRSTDGKLWVLVGLTTSGRLTSICVCLSNISANEMACTQSTDEALRKHHAMRDEVQSTLSATVGVLSNKKMEGDPPTEEAEASSSNTCLLPGYMHELIGSVSSVIQGTQLMSNKQTRSGNSRPFANIDYILDKNILKYYDFSTILLNRITRTFDSKMVLEELFKKVMSKRDSTNGHLLEDASTLTNNRTIKLNSLIKINGGKSLDVQLHRLQEMVENDELIHWVCTTEPLDYEEETMDWRIENNFEHIHTLNNPTTGATSFCVCGEMEAVKRVVSGAVDSNCFVDGIEVSVGDNRKVPSKYLRKRSKYLKGRRLMFEVLKSNISMQSMERVGDLQQLRAAVPSSILSSFAEYIVYYSPLLRIGATPNDVLTNELIQLLQQQTDSDSYCSYNPTCGSRHIHCYTSGSRLQNALKERNSYDFNFSEDPLELQPHTEGSIPHLESFIMGIPIDQELIKELMVYWAPSLLMPSVDPFKKPKPAKIEYIPSLQQPTTIGGLLKSININNREMKRKKASNEKKTLVRTLKGVLNNQLKQLAIASQQRNK